jgi:hypothetical protein
MKDILIFLFGAVASKLIEDNLPNLHYRNLAAGFEKHVMPVLLIAALGFYTVLAKISKDKEVQKTYIILITIILAAITLQKLAQNKKPAAVN